MPPLPTSSTSQQVSGGSPTRLSRRASLAVTNQELVQRVWETVSDQTQATERISTLFRIVEAALVVCSPIVIIANKIRNIFETDTRNIVDLMSMDDPPIFNITVRMKRYYDALHNFVDDGSS